MKTFGTSMSLLFMITATNLRGVLAFSNNILLRTGPKILLLTFVIFYHRYEYTRRPHKY